MLQLIFVLQRFSVVVTTNIWFSHCYNLFALLQGLCVVTILLQRIHVVTILIQHIACNCYNLFDKHCNNGIFWLLQALQTPGLRGDAISRLAVTNRVMATFATHSQFTFQINKELKNLTPLNFFGQMRSSRNRPKKRKWLWPPFATHTQFTFQLNKELSKSNRYRLSPLQHSTN